jgi:hypothetical protein
LSALSDHRVSDIDGQNRGDKEVADHRDVLVLRSASVRQMPHSRDAAKIHAEIAIGNTKLGTASDAVPTTPVAKFAMPSSRTNGSAASPVKPNISLLVKLGWKNCSRPARTNLLPPAQKHEPLPYQYN